MTVPHGKKAVLKLENKSGVLTDITVYCNMIHMEHSVDLENVAGLHDGTINASGTYDLTLDTMVSSVFGQDALLAYECSPKGTTAGSPKYTGECLVRSFDTSFGLTGKETFSLNLQCSGELTKSAH